VRQKACLKARLLYLQRQNENKRSLRFERALLGAFSGRNDTRFLPKINVRKNQGVVVIPGTSPICWPSWSSARQRSFTPAPH